MNWTWGEIKQLIESQGINDETPIWYIDVNKEKPDREIKIVNEHMTYGAEITNHPEQ